MYSHVEFARMNTPLAPALKRYSIFRIIKIIKMGLMIQKEIKIYNIACALSKVSDQPAQMCRVWSQSDQSSLSSWIRYRYAIDYPESALRKFLSDREDTQADLNLRWTQMQISRKCCALPRKKNWIFSYPKHTQRKRRLSKLPQADEQADLSLCLA